MYAIDNRESFEEVRRLQEQIWESKQGQPGFTKVRVGGRGRVHRGTIGAGGKVHQGTGRVGLQKQIWESKQGQPGFTEVRGWWDSQDSLGVWGQPSLFLQSVGRVCLGRVHYNVPRVLGPHMVLVGEAQPGL